MKELWNVQSNKKPWINFVTLFFIIGATFFSSISPTFANTAAISWLQLNSSQDGSYSLSADIALPFQSTSEAVKALSLTSTTINLNTAVQFLNNDTHQSSEYLSRKIMANITAGNDATSLIAELLKLQNSDGGFGDQIGYQSRVIDTAFALEALGVAQSDNNAVIGSAITYLLEQQSIVGGFSHSSVNQDSVYETALVSIALQKFLINFNVSEAITSANNYLLGAQDPTGGWGSNWETAISLIAIAPVTTDTSQYIKSVSALKASQLINGSWNDDVYQTAIALRATHVVDNVKLPVAPTLGGLTSKVVETLSTVPLSGVTVSLGDGTISTVTGGDGRFSLSDIPPGDYTITYSKPGYATVSHAFTSVAGQVLIIEKVLLTRNLDIGVISGIVTDANTHLPLSGISVQLTGAENQVTTTNANGTYGFAATAGSVTVSVSAPTYEVSTATIALTAGSNVNFSPALIPVGQDNSNVQVELSGQVIASDSGNAIANTLIKISAQLLESHSTADGNFTLSGIAPGGITVEFSAPGFQPRLYSLQAPEGSILNIGTVALLPVNTDISTITLTGTIFENGTLSPVPGAIVTIEGTTLFGTTDTEGRYTIEGIQQLNFSVLVRAGGYISALRSLNFTEFTTSTFDLALQRASLDGIEIVQQSTDLLSYPAYASVNISMMLENKGVNSKDLQLLAEIVDSNGRVIYKPVVGPSTASGAASSLILLPGNTIDISGQWFTGIELPGIYQLKTRVFDRFSGQELSQRISTFAIDTTQRITELSINVTPQFVHSGAQAQVTLTATAINRSNVTSELLFSYELTDPQGNTVKTGDAHLVIQPDESTKTLQLSSFPYLFVTSGEYAIAVRNINSIHPVVVHTQPIQVAPAIRVDIEQGLDTSTVIPDGDKRIRINIRIKGAQQ